MFTAKRTAFRILFSWITCIVSVTASTSAPLLPRHVGLSLFHPDGGARLEVPRGAKLSVQRKRIKGGQSLAAALLANGIVADQDAYRLVYDLNPEVLDLETDALPAVLNLPTVVFPGDKAALLKGYLVRLSVDEDLKQRVVEAISRLEQQAKSLPQGSDTSVLNREAYRSVDATTRILSVVKSSLEQGSQPVGTSLLKQLEDEAGFTANLLMSVSVTKLPFTPDEVELLKAVEEDVVAKAPTFDETRAAGEPPKRWREVRVRVNVLPAGGGKEVPYLRVSYAPPWLLNRQGYPFGRVTPNAVEKVPEGNYYFWAAIDRTPPPAAPAAGPLFRRIRVTGEKGDLVVDLTLNR